jgi:4-amino-4-deoxy-L-arabinose transferase-like glycosyltransferase
VRLPVQQSPARDRGLTVLLLVGAAAGVALRVWLWRSPFGQVESDEAVWGLMARHVLDGELSAFYWGQGYGGTLEALLTAVPFAAFGSSWVAARLVPLLLTAAAALLVWRVGVRTIGEPAARIAAVLFWVFPAFLVWKSIRAHGFYGSGLVLALLLLLLVLRLAERRSRRDAALLGLVVGVGLWQTAQLVAVLAPALGWLTWRHRSVWRDAWLAVPGTVVGMLPWIVSNLRHEWWSLHVEARDAPGYVSRLRGFGSATLPMALDLRLPFTSEWAAGRLVTGLAYAALLVLFTVVAWRQRRSNVSLLVAVAAAYPFLYAISSYTWLIDEPRYLVLLMPVLVLLLALPLNTAARGAVGLGVAVLLTAAAFGRMDADRYRVQADGHLVPREFAPLVDELDALGIRRVFGHYWIVYRLAFETDERIVGAEADMGTLGIVGAAVRPAPPDDTTRFPPYHDRVRELRAPAWALRSGSTRDRRWRPLFARAGYARVEVGGFAVYHKGAQSAG